MTENEPRSRPQHPRKNPQFRPPPGVQKALHNFGVPDLRQLLDRKHQEQKPEEQTPTRKAKLPPPDPEYNYLKDPTRDVSTPKEEKKKNNPRGKRPEQQNNNQGGPSQAETTPKKELRFSDTVTNIKQSETKGRKSPKVLENPVNIKVKLTLETGQRSCELDENTIIPDIKHIPDQKPLRGGFRGRGYRGRGRGRGSFRGRRDYKKPPNQNSSENASETQEEGEYGDSNENYEDPKQPFDANLAGSITITSSNFQEGEVQRDVQVNSEEPEEK